MTRNQMPGGQFACLMRMIGFLGLFAIACLCAAQSFEVASIRPNHSDSTDSNVDSTAGGLLRVNNESLKELIKLAFGVKDYQIAGAPGWIGSERYDITAKTAQPVNPGFEEEKQLIRSLLTERFALKTHVETRESTVYSLSIGRNGAKLTRHDDGSGTTARTTCGHMTGRRLTTAVLATMLSRQLEHDVLDQTGLPGKYDFQLDWLPDSGPCPDSPRDQPSVFTAVQEQLGLRLESTKGPTEILVIDHIEPPSEN
jgi:uncharacterized protein (TIGR03435 family)